MSIMSGTMSVTRFTVDGDTPDMGTIRQRLDDFGFLEKPIDQGKEENYGWVIQNDILNSSFSTSNDWSFDKYIFFSYRVDKKKLPSVLVKAYINNAIELWCTKNGVPKCPSAVKKTIKESIIADLIKRQVQSVSVTEVCWNMVDSYVIVGSQSKGTCEAIKKRFYKTFGVKLNELSPLDNLEEASEIDRLLAVGPFQMALFGGGL